MTVLKLIQWLNDATPCLNAIKEHLPFRDALYGVLVRTCGAHEVEKLRTGFNDHYVTDRLTALAPGLVPIFYVLLPNAIGDLIACEPISRHLKRLAPQSTVKWLVMKPLVEVVATNPLIDEVVPIDSLKEGCEICKENESNPASIIIWSRLHRTSCLKTGFLFYNPVNTVLDFSNYYSFGNLLEVFCWASGLPALQDQPNYCLNGTRTLFDHKGRPYVVIHCNTSTALRNWTPEKWNAIAKYLTYKGFTVVEVGTEKVISSSVMNYIDLTGRQYIPDVIRTISEARFFMGCDSCFAHAANAVNVPAIVLFGRFEQWDVYNPYSGEFARRNFRILRAEKGDRVATISTDLVMRTIDQMTRNG